MPFRGARRIFGPDNRRRSFTSAHDADADAGRPLLIR